MEYRQWFFFVVLQLFVFTKVQIVSYRVLKFVTESKVFYGRSDFVFYV